MIDQIIDFENGMLSEVEEIKFFSNLVRTGMAWQLQGMYGRHAKSLIDNRVIDIEGNVLIDLNDVI
jgi:hypothetical protein